MPILRPTPRPRCTQSAPDQARGFGDVVVSGTDRTDAAYIIALKTFERGEIHRRDAIDDFRTALAETGLYREISIDPALPDDAGYSNILVTVSERKHRTVGAGLSFGTDVGVGGSLFWENRNMFGRGETVLARVAYAAPRQEAAMTFTKPIPKWPGSWRISALGENEDTDAFNAKTATLGAGVQKYFRNDTFEFTADVNYQYSEITDGDGTKSTFSSASIPVAGIYNNENDLLDPTRGARARIVVTPYFGDTQFTQVDLGGATRIAFGSDESTVLATRVRLGGSFGATRTEIPATERFYAGGGGSVRGYGFQEAGPIDEENGSPLGGASLVEINLEARQHIAGPLQIAVFADGGTVFESNAPNFSNEILWGAGFGFRYRTPVGPIRFDIATPLDSRDIAGVDEFGEPLVDDDDNPVSVFSDPSVQIYIALGQSF